MSRAKEGDDVDMEGPMEVDARFHVPILETVKAAQQQNGLRHRDFQRYRQYCARRLRRLRKSLKFLHGKGKVYVSKKVDEETASEARHLYILLYNAERAWGFAMQLKEDDNLEKTEYGDEANSRIKFHLQGRLRKAAEWSQRLVTLCAAKADARTSLEAEAYAAYMTGNLAFHREEHEQALQSFLTARRIYADLSQVGTLSQQELFRGFADELNPFVRFCEHRLTLLGKRSVPTDPSTEWTSAAAGTEALGGASNSLLQSKIEMVLLEARKQKAADLATVEWKQKQIALPSQEISLAYVRPEEINTRLEQLIAEDAEEKKLEHVYLELLSAYDTLLGALKTEITKLQQQSKSGSALVHSEIEAMQALEEYVRYLKLTKQVERTAEIYQRLRSRAVQPGDMLHMLDMLIQNIGDILSIPGLREAEPKITAKYTAYQTVYKAVRASHAAQAYVGDRKFSDALALYNYASAFLSEADETLTLYPGAKDLLLQRTMQELDEELSGAQSRTTALQLLDASKQTDTVRAQLQGLSIVESTTSMSKKKKKRQASGTSKPLLARQLEYNWGTVAGAHELVSLSPEFQAMPCKPLLLDLAFNALDVPDLSDRMKTEEEKKAEELAAKKSSATGSGLFGWFRSG